MRLDEFGAKADSLGNQMESGNKNAPKGTIYFGFIVYLQKKLSVMNFTGIVVGLATFLVIGIFHPIVIKAEYYLGTKCWWMFLIAGIVFCALSIVVDNLIASTILGVTAFSSFWSILEVIHQKKRVDKGWFPEGPGHNK